MLLLLVPVCAQRLNSVYSEFRALARFSFSIFFPPSSLPNSMHLSALKSLHVSQLIEMAYRLEIESANRLRKQELMFAILKWLSRIGEAIFFDGTLEVLPDGIRFLRSPETSYLASPVDIYISTS